MEALWNLEDKWKLTTKDAVGFLACTSFLVTALCIVTILNRRGKRKAASLIHQEPWPCMEDDESSTSTSISRRPPPKQQQPRWDCVKTMLMSKVRWSRVISRGDWEGNWEGEGLQLHQVENIRPTTTSNLLVMSARYDDQGINVVGMGMGLLQSHDSTSAVWQRPILMGEKCELPRFSGLILYDERGRPLQFGDQEQQLSLSHHHHLQEGCEASGITTLKELLI